MTVCISVIGIHGLGVDCGCIFQPFEYYECSLSELGHKLYEILNRHPFQEYRIELEYYN